MRATWLAFVLAGFASTAAAQDSLRVNMTAIDLDVSLDYKKRALEGVAVLSVRNISKSSTDRIPVQIGRLMEVTSITDARGDRLPFTQDIVRFTDWPQRQVNQAYVTLRAPLRPGDSTSIRVTWNGIVTAYTETGMGYVRERIDSAFTMLREETRAFPAVSVPTESFNRAAGRTDFDFSLRVTVPIHQVVSAGGRLTAVRDTDDKSVYEFRSVRRTPFLNVAIAPYRTVNKDGVRIHYFPSDSTGAEMVSLAVANALAQLERWFGPMGESLDLAISEIPRGYGSQANLAAGIILDAAAFNDRKQLGQLYHELSHLWNARDLDVPSPRWNEGLAGFVEDLLVEQLDGWKERHAYTQRYATTYVERFAADSTNITTPLIEYGIRQKTDLSYSVGYFMFYVLHETVGADSFNRMIGGYYQKHRLRGGTTREFVDYIRTHTPVDLTSFIQDWIYTTDWYHRLRRGESLKDMASSYRTSVRSGMANVVEPLSRTSSR